MLASLAKPFQGKKLGKQANPKAFSFIVSFDCHPTRKSGELRVMLPVLWMKNLRLRELERCTWTSAHAF